MSNLSKDNNKHKVNTINKILRSGTTPVIVKLAENLTEQLAFLYEISYIFLIGRKDLGKGPLCNLTNGGEGTSGNILSEDTKHKISNTISTLGRWKGDNNPSKSEEHKKYMSNILKDRTFSDETKRRMSISSHGSKNGRSKLNEEKVIEIRKLLKNGVSNLEIANIYNVSDTTISLIKNYKAWKHC
jgi:hypothetical protein